MVRNPHPDLALLVSAGVLLSSLLGLAPPSHAGVPEVADSGTVIELRIEDDTTVVVSGLGNAVALSRAAAFDDGDWQQVLHVIARDPERSATGADLPPLLGSYDLDGSTLRFTPRFPPAPGLLLEARFSAWHWNQPWNQDTDTAGTETLAEPLTASYLVPRRDVERTTHVEAVYPATESVPANLLRFYVHFSAPMGARHVLPHVELLDHGGHPIDSAFVEVEGGLWDPSRTRLTLFVHPGRVKRGVGPNQAMGPVLETGKRYTLRIGDDATDDFGRRLTASHEHRFAVGPEDRVSPDPSRWTLTAPTSSDEPLRVELAEPADVALLQRIPVIVDSSGELIPGRIAVASDGSSFEFHPAAAWTPGDYQLWVPATLEDASGNRVGRKFEEAASGSPDDERRPTALGFVVLGD